MIARKRRVLLVSYHFPPSSAVGALRAGRLATGLPEHGFIVDVLCASEESSVESPDESSSLRLPDESRLIRVPTPFVLGRNPSIANLPTHFLGVAFWKLRAHLEWIFLTKDWSWHWGQRALAEVLPELESGRYEALILDGPPRPALAPFASWGRANGVTVITDLRDIWASASTTFSAFSWLSPTLRRSRWFHLLREDTLANSDHVIFNTDVMATFMKERSSALNGAEVSFVPNAYLSSEVDPTPPALNIDNRALELVHTGSVAYGRHHLLIGLIEAVERWNQRQTRPLRLTLVGPRHKQVEELIAARRLNDQVMSIGWCDRVRTIELQRKADILVLFQPDTFGARTATPAKTFEYMCRRKPIFALVPPGPAAALIDESGLGIVCHAVDSSRIESALTDVVEWIVKGRELPSLPKKYSAAETTREFAQIVHLAMSGGSSHG